jgi:ABC-2 type transport system ATP-binding protein
VCQQILNQGTVEDITIQDVPLEDIISEIFSRGMAPAPV